MTDPKMTIRISADFPADQVEAMDTWRAGQTDPHLTRANALEYFVAKGLGLDPPSFANRKRPSTEAERDARAEHYAQLRAELGSIAAVAREVKRSPTTVTQAIARYERKNRGVVQRHRVAE